MAGGNPRRLWTDFWLRHMDIWSMIEAQGDAVWADLADVVGEVQGRYCIVWEGVARGFPAAREMATQTPALDVRDGATQTLGPWVRDASTQTFLPATLGRWTRTVATQTETTRTVLVRERATQTGEQVVGPPLGAETGEPAGMAARESPMPAATSGPPGPMTDERPGPMPPFFFLRSVLDCFLLVSLYMRV